MGDLRRYLSRYHPTLVFSSRSYMHSLDAAAQTDRLNLQKQTKR